MALTVKRAGAAEYGQWVNPGFELARIAQPGRLKAVLRVPETQAKDIAMGIDIPGGTDRDLEGSMGNSGMNWLQMTTQA